MSMTLPLPLPPPEPTQVAFFLFVFAGYIARVLFKGGDHFVQDTEWFKKQPEANQWIIKRLLDLFHHWYVGWAIMVYAPDIAKIGWMPLSRVDVYWVGFAILLDDLPDLPPRLRSAFKDYTFLSRNNDSEEPPSG